MVYTFSGKGRLACIDDKTGNEKWAIDMIAEKGGAPNTFGLSESPLVKGDYVYCFAGGQKHNVLKLNRFDGSEVWSSEALKDTAAYCSPMLIELDNKTIYVNYTADKLFGLDDANGKLLWYHQQDSVKYGDQCNTPIFDAGKIYIQSEGTGAVCLELSHDGNEITEIWRNMDVINYFNGVVKIGNHLICTHRKQKLMRIDCQSGEVVEEIKLHRGSIIEADGMLYVYSDNGKMNLVEYADNGFKVVSSFKIDFGTKEHFSHPVIADGVLYVRHGNGLAAYDISN